MITAYFTNTLKYLEKGNYRKEFDVNSIIELIDKIKAKNEKILIKAKSKDIFDFKFNYGDENEDIYEYDFLPDKPVFGKNPVENILQHFIESKADFMDYSVIDMWQDKLGKLIFICNSKEKKDEILNENVYLAFLPPDLEELQNGMIKENAIPESVVNSIFNIV